MDLTGTWESADYECRGTKRTERVEISHVEQHLTAVKITGDDCVPAGFGTFTGRLPAGSSVGAIMWTTGTPRAPASAQAAGFLMVVDQDTFRAGSEHMSDMTFTRVLDREAHPKRSPSCGTGVAR